MMTETLSTHEGWQRCEHAEKGVKGESLTAHLIDQVELCDFCQVATTSRVAIWEKMSSKDLYVYLNRLLEIWCL